MTQIMHHYSWQVAFDRIEEAGPARIVRLFKLGLKEMPRLEQMFLGSNPDEHQKARDEIIALFRRIDLEMQKAIQESSLSEEAFTKEVKKNSNFTPEEWAQLARVPELIGHHHQELFTRKAYSGPTRRNPFFKV